MITACFYIIKSVMLRNLELNKETFDQNKMLFVNYLEQQVFA